MDAESIVEEVRCIDVSPGEEKRHRARFGVYGA